MSIVDLYFVFDVVLVAKVKVYGVALYFDVTVAQGGQFIGVIVLCVVGVADLD